MWSLRDDAGILKSLAKSFVSGIYRSNHCLKLSICTVLCAFMRSICLPAMHCKCWPLTVWFHYRFRVDDPSSCTSNARCRNSGPGLFNVCSPGRSQRGSLAVAMNLLRCQTLQSHEVWDHRDRTNCGAETCMYKFYFACTYSIRRKGFQGNSSMSQWSW